MAVGGRTSDLNTSKVFLLTRVQILRRPCTENNKNVEYKQKQKSICLAVQNHSTHTLYE